MKTLCTKPGCHNHDSLDNLDNLDDHGNDHDVEEDYEDH